MLLAGWEVLIEKNCDQGLENAARGRKPRAAFSSPRSQFVPIRTCPKPAAVNWLTSGFVYATFSLNWLTRHLQTIRQKSNELGTSKKLSARQRKMYERTDLFRTSLS